MNRHSHWSDELGQPQRSAFQAVGAFSPDQRHVVRGRAARCADRRSAFQAVGAFSRDQRNVVRGPAARCADRRLALSLG